MAEFQDDIFGQQLREKQLRRWGKKEKLDGWHKERERHYEEQELRRRREFKQPMHSWSPEMKKRYNDLMARQAEEKENYGGGSDRE